MGRVQVKLKLDEKIVRGGRSSSSRVFQQQDGGIHERAAPSLTEIGVKTREGVTPTRICTNPSVIVKWV